MEDVQRMQAELQALRDSLNEALQSQVGDQAGMPSQVGDQAVALVMWRCCDMLVLFHPIPLRSPPQATCTSRLRTPSPS